jgi:7-cyano-7-deazaguanine synthase in queuosine biosynthesis
MQTQTIEFDSIDEIVEIVETRFSNARVEFIESMRESLIDDLRQFDKLTFDFIEFHNVIENNLRNVVALHYAREYAKNNDEFENVVAIVDESTFHNFAIVSLNVETRVAIIITMIRVNDNLTIELFDAN